MYTKAIRKNVLCFYGQVKYALTGYMRFQFPHESTKPSVVTKFPGSAHLNALE